MAAPTFIPLEHKLIAGLAEMIVTNNPNATLATYSLGSCLGVAVYDPVAHVGGLLHLMLPDSSIDPIKAAKQPGMFVDSGVPALFRLAYQFHAEKHRMRIYVAGGAQIMDAAGHFNIGKRNCEAVAKLFAEHHLQVSAWEVGGLNNRSMYLNVKTGQVTLKVSGQISEMSL